MVAQLHLTFDKETVIREALYSGMVKVEVGASWIVWPTGPLRRVELAGLSGVQTTGRKWGLSAMSSSDYPYTAMHGDFGGEDSLTEPAQRKDGLSLECSLRLRRGR